MSSPTTLSHPWEPTTRSNTTADKLYRAIVRYNKLVRDAKQSAEEYDRLHKELHMVYALQRKIDSDKQSFIIQGNDMSVMALLLEQSNKDREYRSKGMKEEREYWTETLKKARAVKEQMLRWEKLLAAEEKAADGNKASPEKKGEPHHLLILPPTKSFTLIISTPTTSATTSPQKPLTPPSPHAPNQTTVKPPCRTPKETKKPSNTPPPKMTTTPPTTPDPKPASHHLANALVDQAYLAHLARKFQKDYTTYHHRIHATYARVRELERNRRRLAPGKYMRERRWSELDRCEMAKRMRMEREGWREVVGKLRGVNERVRELEAIVEAEQEEEEEEVQKEEGEREEREEGTGGSM
ncbi:hypothetical protein MMC08_008601 [Hypocenomyce scalaris]|nr:hypothetical protein [Hypocenomyce scalaris]